MIRGRDRSESVETVFIGRSPAARRRQRSPSRGTPTEAPSLSARIEGSAIGPILAAAEGVSSRLDRPSTRTEILVGRSLAMCVHPYAAWRSHSARGRLLVFAAYLGASYVLILGGLLVSF